MNRARLSFTIVEITALPEDITKLIWLKVNNN